jgi:transcriptional regulator
MTGKEAAMHPNPAYRQASPDRNLAFARLRGFGVLMLNGADGPLAAHVPFVLNAEGTVAELHLVRSNPVARALGAAQPALIAVSGPDGYVSPDWYATEHQVPTWNYVAVHLRGNLEQLPHDQLRGHLDRLSAAFENRLLPKTPWLTDKMPDDALERLMRQIVPCRFTIAVVQGTWKLNQNKSAAARLGAAAGIAASPIGQELSALAALMREAES